MNQENKNIDELLDGKLKSGLFSFTSDAFSDEVMKRVNLSIEFAREDVKTYKLAKLVTAGISAFIFLFVSVILYYLSKNPGENNVEGYFSLNSVYEYISRISVKILGILGFTGSLESFLFLILLGVIIILFVISDRRLLKKNLSS